MTKRTIRLTSTNMIHAPGILRWAMNGFKFPKDRKRMRDVMKSWPARLTDKQWNDVLSGKISHKVEGEDVVIAV